jgi:O-succinylbenzoic acid--CoA ligase
MERLELIRLLGARSALAEPMPLRVVEEREPERFMTAFAQAVAEAETVLVCDPAWGAAERAQLAALLNSEPKTQNSKPALRAGWLCLPTGGTTGQLRFARHDQDTLSAAVRGFCAHFKLTTVNAVGVLPLHHVSGLMAWMRCALTGGRYVPWDWKQLEAGAMPALSEGGGWFLSLVPTQLQRLLLQPAAVDRLRRFRAIFLGGGPAWPELLEAAAAAQLPLALSYGMTETAAMIATQRPEEFLAGARSCGAVMPHAQIEISAEGLIRIRGDSLFRGYFPDWREPQPFATEDLGHFDAVGQLHIDGRRDAVIITGGKKVAPAEVEAALRATGKFADVAVVGVSDAEWGQIVVACYPAKQAAPDLPAIDEMLSRDLAAYKRPKHYLAVDPWPRNAQGKIDRVALLSALNRSPL